MTDRDMNERDVNERDMTEREDGVAHEDAAPLEGDAGPELTPEEAAAAEAAQRRARTRGVTLLILAVVIVAAGAALVIANVGGQEDPTSVPEEWQVADLDGAETVELDDGLHSAVVVVSAADETCWHGYIVDQELEGCGPKTFKVEATRATLGINATSNEATKNFLGVAVWDGQAQRLITSGKTQKRFGTVALTAEIAVQ